MEAPSPTSGRHFSNCAQDLEDSGTPWGFDRRIVQLRNNNIQAEFFSWLGFLETVDHGFPF
jgi:hypothetical protein